MVRARSWYQVQWVDEVGTSPSGSGWTPRRHDSEPLALQGGPTKEGYNGGIPQSWRQVPPREGSGTGRAGPILGTGPEYGGTRRTRAPVIPIPVHGRVREDSGNCYGRSSAYLSLSDREQTVTTRPGVGRVTVPLFPVASAEPKVRF